MGALRENVVPFVLLTLSKNIFLMNTTPKIFVTDFDGTMTRYDFYDLAVARLPSVSTRDYWAEYTQGRLTHFEALAGIFASIRAPLESVEEILDAMEFDPQAPAALRKLRAAGWHVIIASAGSSWYIEKLLARAGIRSDEVELHANPGAYSPDTGLCLRLPKDDPFFDPQVGIGKAAIVRHAISQVRAPLHVAFAGDGRPDWPPAQEMLSHQLFATGWLAHRLSSHNFPFTPFSRWHEIAPLLLQTS